MTSELGVRYATTVDGRPSPWVAAVLGAELALLATLSVAAPAVIEET
ncbi:hypothetical protein ACPYPG_02315 [Streptomyces sp. FR-108]